MKIKVFSILIILVAALAASAARKSEVTLVMVPREDSTVRLGLDLANRYPTLLISYEVKPNKPVSLHGWSGKEWVNISLDDFHAGNFFRTGPDSALLIEEEGTAVPETLIPPVGWCDAAYKITTTQTRPLLHLVGQYYDFKYKEWQWFSENYKLSMDAINPEGLNVAWYHKRFGDNLKKSPVAADDLQYWVAIRHPVVLEELPEAVEEETQPEMELPGDPEVNPLTNAVPEAVVLSAGDAEEAARAE
ncbi:hypothetical protein P4B35_05745 [Pontiellaceae bacterium B12227]|nr:hypothetical protein [Pontiellaceae bacterium B12227]